MAPEEVEQSVRKWLASERMEIREQNDSRALMHLLVKYPPGKNGHMFAVVIPKGRDLLAISSMTRVDGGQQKAMQEMINTEVEEWRTWVHDCRIQLISSGADWAVHMGHAPKGKFGPLQAFNVSEPIWFDGISKNEVMQTLRRLWLAKLGIIHEIKYTFGPGTGAPGPVDDWKDSKGKGQNIPSKKQTTMEEVHTDETMTFGSGFDPSDWV